MKNQIVEFNNQNLEIINRNGQLYLSGVQIGKALEYDNPAKAVGNIYRNHQEEFTDDMSMTLDLRVIRKRDRNYLSRVYNREGAWLIGMFARTPKAAEFRKWVLKVLGAVADDKPVIVSEHTRSLPSGRKEIVLSEKAKEEVGGIVKAVVHSEINKLFTGSELPKSDFWEVNDKDLIGALYNWHLTKNKKDTEKFQKLNATVDRLMVENAALKETIRNTKNCLVNW